MEEGLREESFVHLRGARQNNLQGLDWDLPLGKLTVVTGVDYLYEAYKLRKASLAAGGPVALRDGRWQPLADEPVAPAQQADHEPPS